MKENNLKLYREANGISISKIAEFLNIDESLYKLYENSEVSVDIDDIEKLSDLYGISSFDLMYAYYIEEPENTLIKSLGLSDAPVNDLREIARFRSIIKAYEKMREIESRKI